MRLVCAGVSLIPEASDPTHDNKAVMSEAPGGKGDECGHPKHAALPSKDSAIPGCDGFVPATQA